MLELARLDPSIYVITTDSRGSVTISGFAESLPDQFVEVGIAEQNAVAMAAGLAITGKNVFVAGPACFLAARAFEQIKIDVAYNKSNVKIVGVSAGVSYGPLGGTHTSLHDFAGIRALPNIFIFAPCDAVQSAFITGYLASYNGPAYMRMGRGDVHRVYGDGECFVPGNAKTVQNGSDATIIACGEMVYYAKKAAELMEARGVSVRVLDMFTIKPVDADAIISAARETKAIVTVEEHSIFGGLGEQVSHIVSEISPVRMKIMGFPDEECKIGKSSELFEYYGLTPEGIAREVGRLL